MPDYSSQLYWENRLLREDLDGFEWLASSEDIFPHFVPLLDHQLPKPAHVLHFGCGSSTLGIDIQRRFGASVKVYDADYAIQDTQRMFMKPAPVEVPVLHVNALRLQELRDSQPEGGWDILVDKSTADAIACGEPITEAQSNNLSRVPSEPIELLCTNLYKVTKPGAMWLSISYSSSRFDFLSSSGESLGWRVSGKSPIHCERGGRQEIVHRPETSNWAWLLQRL